MVDMLIKVMAIVRHKKLRRTRGTGKRRSVFFFRHATHTFYKDVMPINIGHVSEVDGKIDCTVTFSHSNAEQTTARGMRDHRPVDIYPHQAQEISKLKSAILPLPTGKGKYECLDLDGGVSGTTIWSDKTALVPDSPVSESAFGCTDIARIWKDLQKAHEVTAPILEEDEKLKKLIGTEFDVVLKTPEYLGQDAAGTRIGTMKIVNSSEGLGMNKPLVTVKNVNP